MGIRIGSVVITVADIEVMSRFWCAALGLQPGRGDDFRVLRGDRVNLSLQVAESPTARDHLHLDLYSPDQEAEVARLEALGASAVSHHEHPDDDFVLMRDPEGNEFCVCLVEAS